MHLRDVGFGHALQHIVRANLAAMAWVVAASPKLGKSPAAFRTTLRCAGFGPRYSQGSLPLCWRLRLDATARVVLIYGWAIRWEGPHLEVQVARALRPLVPLADFGELFVARP